MKICFAFTFSFFRLSEPPIFAGLGIPSLVFRANCSFFCERKSNVLLKKSKSLALLLCKEQREQITHGHSFVKSDRAKSDGSNSLLGIKREKQ